MLGGGGDLHRLQRLTWLVKRTREGTTEQCFQPEKAMQLQVRGGWTQSAKHTGASCRFELSCNKPLCCADFTECQILILKREKVGLFGNLFDLSFPFTVC